MNITIFPSELKGIVTAPPSKSYAHRMMICAAFTNGMSSVRGISASEDMLATLDCLSALGIRHEKDGADVTVEGLFSGAAPKGSGQPAEAACFRGVSCGEQPVFPCRESGSTLRFFIPVALAVCGGGIFTGAPRLIERGAGIYEDLFRDNGIRFEKTKTAIRVKGTLKSGTYRLRGDVSSQFVTGMLFALSLLEEDSVLEVLPPIESRSYIDITIDVMKTFGVIVEEPSSGCFHVKGGQKYRAGNYRVEGDWSNAAFLYAFQILGNDLMIEGLNQNSIQGDRICREHLTALSGKKTGGSDFGKDLDIDLSDTPDLGPVLFAAAAALRGGCFTGTRRLRIKESDRAAAMAEELKKFGIRCLVGENEVMVLHGLLKKPDIPLNGHNDHRIVMSLSVLLSLTGGVIEGAEAVRKSWPDFFKTMQMLGLKIEPNEAPA